jgi:hypothetical protein
LYGRGFFYLRFLITPFDHCMVGTSFIYGFWLHLLTILLSVLLLFTVSDYTFWPLDGRYFFYLRFLITPFDHCMVGTSFIYGLWLHLLTIVWLVLLLFTVSDYTFWPLYGRYFFYLQFLITSFHHCMVEVSFIYGFWLHLLIISWLVLLLFTVSNYTFWSLYGWYFFYLLFLVTSFDHCMVGTSFIYCY